MMLRPQRLETPRLILRRFETRDIATFAAYRADPEVARYQGWQVPYSYQQARQFVMDETSRETIEPDQWVQLAIELKARDAMLGAKLGAMLGAMVGDCAFYLSANDPRQGEIGMTLARAHQGQGFATEAVARLLDYLFGELDLHRVRANCDPENTASIRLLERIGMRHEGRWVQSLWFKGRWADEDWYAMLRQEWETRQNRAR